MPTPQNAQYAPWPEKMETSWMQQQPVTAHMTLNVLTAAENPKKTTTTLLIHADAQQG